MTDDRLRKLLDRIYQRAPAPQQTATVSLPPAPAMPGAAATEPPRRPQATVIQIRLDDDPGLLAQRSGLPALAWADVQAHFPKALPRPGQEALLRLALAGLERYDDVLIEAPTGLGKTAVAKAAANWAQRAGDTAYLVAHRNFLLHQYTADHPDLPLIKGMNNYECILEGHEETPVHRAPCQKQARFRCPEKDACPYFSARDRALAAPQTLTNYDYLYWSGAANEQFPPRGLLVLDEAHNLEESLLKNFQFHLTDAWIRGLLGRGAPADTVARLQAAPDAKAKADILLHLWRLVKRHYDDLTRDARTGRMTPERLPPEDRRRYEGALARLHFLAAELHARPHNWVEKARRGQDEPAGLEFKPVTVAPYASQLLELGRKRIHLTATLLDHDVYMRALGIERALVLKVVESPFPAQNRPVLNLHVARLNRDTLDASLPKLLDAIDRVLDRHPSEKGLILPFTNRLHDAIAAAPLRNAERLVTHTKTAADRDRALAGFLTEKTGNRVLVSTYANEGLDFIDAAARFCIIVKTPYPDLGDPQVRARTDRDRGWYENETLKSIIQMAGRIVRTPEDHGTTYILDANADTLIRRNPAAVPRWFLQAYRLASS